MPELKLKTAIGNYGHVRALKDGTLQPRDGADARLARLQQLVGADPYPYGVEANRPTLEAIIKFAYDQHVLSQAPKVEDIFVPSTVGLR